MARVQRSKKKLDPYLGWPIVVKLRMRNDKGRWSESIELFSTPEIAKLTLSYWGRCKQSLRVTFLKGETS